MTLLYIKKYTRVYIQSHPDWLFVFGDNLERRGLGGQAGQVRGEPNAIGIATKRAPTMERDAFLNDGDYNDWFVEEKPTLARLIKASQNDRTIIWPLFGLNTRLANLEKSAPRIWNDIEQLRISIE